MKPIADNFMLCGDCGKEFDMSDLVQVFFHEQPIGPDGNHEPLEETKREMLSRATPGVRIK